MPDSHDPRTETPADRPCPRWCLDRQYAGTPDHPARHESMVYAVEGLRASGRTAWLNAMLVQNVGTEDIYIVVGRRDEDYIFLRTPGSRSCAAMLTRLANVGEGISA